MRNFLKIADGVDVKPLLLDLYRLPELWNQFPVRTFHERTAHRKIDDILLRYNAFDPTKDDFVDKVCSSIEVVNYPALARLPLAYGLIHMLMNRVRGEHLGRCFISRMAPGVVIPPHTDRIEPAEEAFPDRIRPAAYYHRYQITLQSAPGVVFSCGDEDLEQIYMVPGEVWWFNNEKTHAVQNGSGEDRIALVVDIHSADAGYEPAGWEAIH